jgi:hypothetical protein
LIFFSAIEEVMIGEGKDESIGPKGRGDNQKSD